MVLEFLIVSLTLANEIKAQQIQTPLLSPIPEPIVTITQSPTVLASQTTNQAITIVQSTNMPSASPTPPPAGGPTTQQTITPTNTISPTVAPTETTEPTTSPTITITPSSIPTSSPKTTTQPEASESAQLSQTKETEKPTSTPTPTATPKPTPISKAELDVLFAKYADEYKVDKDQLKRIAQCESGLNPNATNMYYAGLYQFAPASWKGYRQLMGKRTDPKLRFDPEAAINTAAFMLSTGRASAWPNCK